MRRGMTFIEVALAVALLSGIAGVIATAYDGINRLGALEQQKLYAVEVAHRLILNYLLDPKSLPDEGERIPYSSDFFYRHELSVDILIEEKNGSDDTVTRRRPVAQRSVDKDARFTAGLKMVTVRVYPWPGAGVGNPDEPLAELHRVFSPIDPSKDQDILLRQIEDLMNRQIPLPANADPRGSSGGAPR